MQIRMRNFKKLVPVWNTPFYQIPPPHRDVVRKASQMADVLCVCVYVADKQKEEENDDLFK
jgi:phosphopantetheine adenylyltransferase